MGRGKGVNTKVQAGLEKKAENKRAKDAVAARTREEEETKEWSKGSNTRAANRREAEESKADEAARKRREKAELLAAEEAALSTAPKPKKSLTGNTKKSKKKNKDSLALLEESLIKDADKKVKADKRAQRLKKEKEEREANERRRQEQMKHGDNDNIDPLLKNTYHNQEDDTIGRKVNKQSLEEGGGTGIDSALSSLNIQKDKDQHPEKRMKAAYKAYEEKMLPVMKEEYPGLKLSQYKEKIFTSWKKSPENPMNQQL